MTDTDVRVLDEILSEKQKELAPEMDEGEFFEFFTAREILRNYSSTASDIISGNIGRKQQGENGSDGGIDSLYLLVNGRFINDMDAAEELQSLKQNVQVDLILIQSSREKGFFLNRILRLSEAVENILSLGRNPGDFTEQYKEELLDSIQRFRTAHRVLVAKRPIINVSYFYASKGDTDKVAPDVESKARGLEGKTRNLLATVSKATFTFVGARELIDFALKPPMKPRTLPYVGLMDSPKGGYAAFVKLSDFYKFISDDGEILDYLFDFNVRDYQGDVEVNKGIRESLTDQPSHEDFWWRNNGITIVASHAGPGDYRELVIEEPYVVNGLQTSQEIFDYFKVNQETSRNDDRQALVRIIASSDSETQDSIIRATNSQTGMGPASLWATDPIHRDLEKVFPHVGLFYDRRKSYWRNRDIPITKIVSIQELAQSLIAIVLQEPDMARARPSRYFKQRNRALYRRVFAKYYPIDLYTACALTRKAAEAFLRTAEADSNHRNNLLFYVLMVVACLAIKSSHPKPTILARRLTTSPVDDALLSEALKLVKPLYIACGADDKAAKGPDLVKQIKESLAVLFPTKGETHEKEVS